jgi:hypothetical protein
MDELGNVEWFFPANPYSATTAPGQNPVTANQVVRIPREPGMALRLDRTSGFEAVFAILSREPWPAVTNLLAQAALESRDETRRRSSVPLENRDVTRPSRLETGDHSILRFTFRRAP